MNAAFRVDGGKVKSSVESHAIDVDFVYTAFDVLVRITSSFLPVLLLILSNNCFSPFLQANLPQELQKTVLRGIVSTLLKDKKFEAGFQRHDDLRAFFILLQNPQFDVASTFIILAHLVRQVEAVESDSY